MRVIHITQCADNNTLGVEKAVVNLALAQKAHGSDVLIAINRHGTFTDSCLEQGIPVVEHESLAAREGAPTRDDIAGLAEFIKSVNPDIIHCHLHVAEVAVRAGNQLNIPCVFTGDSWRRSVPSRVAGLRLSIICLTKYNFDELKKRAPDIDCYYVPNGTRIAPEASARPVGVDHHVNLIFAGSLERRKGIDVAILAMVELRRKLGQDCPVLNIYGDGKERDYLAEMTAILELDDIVRFHGFNSGILETCPSTDMLILPSRIESSPLVVLEAMSRGMPIVASDVGDVPNIIPDSRYGIVIPRDSGMALAEAIQALLADVAAGRFDRDFVIERHRSLYSFEAWAERIEVVYEQILLNAAAAA